AYIKDGGAQGQNGNGHPHARGEVDDAERRQRAGEDECLERLEPTIGQRPMSRPLHPRVDITLDVLVQRQRPAGRQERAEQQGREGDKTRRSGKRHEIPDERGREDHDQHTRLRERDEVGYEPVSISRQRRDDHFDLPTHRPTTYTTVKTTTHTPSTKCQYQDTSSTRSAWTDLSAPQNATGTHTQRGTPPTTRGNAHTPRSEKNPARKGWVRMVSPQPTISPPPPRAVPARNARPSTTVTNSHVPARAMRPAASARVAR